MPFSTPVVFFVFNRPAVTERVFREIAKCRPAHLMVVGDGARPQRRGEDELVDATRSIIDRVDWECDLRTNFSDVNLGCKQRVASGLEWVFSSVGEAIILEDDCLPNPSFFSFCQQMLDRYRDDTRVSNICASNFQDGQSRSQHGYYFSKYFHCWGWASWRRTWETFDIHLDTWPEFLAMQGLAEVADSAEEVRYWRRIFDQQVRVESNSWAYSWLYSSFAQRGLNVLPDHNLTSNIGFGGDATHTSGGDSHLANMSTRSVFVSSHPQTVIRHKTADQYTFHHVYRRPRGVKKLRRSITKRLSQLRPKAA